MCKKIIIIISTVIFIDQITKLLVVMNYEKTIQLIGDVFRITYIKNPYAIFGIKINLPIIPLTFIAVFFIFLLLFKSKILTVAFIFGGAVSNLIDRIFRDGVVDWIDIGIGSFRWPVFNIADAVITISIIWFILTYKEKTNAEKV